MRFFFCTFFSLLACCYAQEVAPKTSKVEFYISSSARIKNLHYGLFDKEGLLVGSVPLAFKTSGTSDLYTYEGPMPLVFFEEEARPTPENPSAVFRKPVAQISLPPDSEQVLLLFAPQLAATENTYLYHVVSVNVRPSSIPVGHISIFNFTKQNFFGSIGEKIKKGDPNVIEIVPGINRPVPIQPKGTVRLIFEFGNEEWVKVYENVFECDSGERLLLIIYPPRVSGSLNLSGRLIRIPDSNENPEENPTAPTGPQSPVSDTE
jgi:hypothetical protein